WRPLYARSAGIAGKRALFHLSLIGTPASPRHGNRAAGVSDRESRNEQEHYSPWLRVNSPLAGRWAPAAGHVDSAPRVVGAYHRFAQWCAVIALGAIRNDEACCSRASAPAPN